MTSLSRTTLMCKSDTYDPKEPFWKIVKINQALHLTKSNQLVIIENLQRDLKDHVFDSTHYKISAPTPIPLATRNYITELRHQNKWLGTKIFQPDNHEREFWIPQVHGYCHCFICLIRSSYVSPNPASKMTVR
ncbi:hypothetical protein AO1008_07212 [Aspergillus oryzae 100-8]|nr:hypothetical protein AO1008_07212 [Aspergillus oryzae 100-8]